MFNMLPAWLSQSFSMRFSIHQYAACAPSHPQTRMVKPSNGIFSSVCK